MTMAAGLRARAKALDRIHRSLRSARQTSTLPMMHGLEKSDFAIVAVKPANKAGRPAAE